ncbi:hypothetical protein OC846_001429 [Tilletia horrida]|uniref:Uncharacterized protein n=1 Tax=Tilletia horrida TaxID=155126 RepID=A0AAN6GWG1_9BASI|nr:hypothetical protein OC845_001526 [Tilletia horrida]KAK0556099.1 hypothetical protein OC846_001429 [Tilletia horrida]KAK0568782.1 hypothetical protein OC861_001634 [Tilletia horrida]
MALQVNTANLLIQCIPYTISWSGGQAPYFLAITAPNDIGSVLENLGTQNGHSYTWKVDQPVSSKVVFAITDSAGTSALSAPSPPIAKGATSSCSNGISDDKPGPSSHNGTLSSSPKNATSNGGKNNTDTDGDSNSNDPKFAPSPFPAVPNTPSVTPDTPNQPAPGTSNVPPAINSAHTNKRGVAALIGALGVAIALAFSG